MIITPHRLCPENRVRLLLLTARLHWSRDEASICAPRPYQWKESAALRSLYPIVLGLGGWFLGLLVVLTMMPGFPPDSALLATLSIGGPIGLGIYLAWVHRDRPAPTKSKGFAAAMGGALVGAWLGFNAAGDLLALVTAIVGAAAGANLAVILFDIVEARRGDRLPENMPVVQAPARVDV